MTPPVPARGPFHPGELAAQQLAGGGSPGGAIRDFMPDQHRRFFAALPFVVVATVEDRSPAAATAGSPENRAGSSAMTTAESPADRAGLPVIATSKSSTNRAVSSAAATIDSAGTSGDESAGSHAASSSAASVDSSASRAGSPGAATADSPAHHAASPVAATIDLLAYHAPSAARAAFDPPGGHADLRGVAAVDARGYGAASSGTAIDTRWPVATIWTGAPGFVTTPDERTLHIAVDLATADPASRAFAPGAPFGMLGIELATRRRNRANGTIAAVDASGLTIAVHQSFGNCQKYIHRRAVAAGAATESRTELFDHLDAAAAAAITAADTFFVASAARADQPTGGVDISHRGGPRGFIRINGDTLTIPDYPGNRYFNTLGNLLASPRAALLFIDFLSGDVLHLQGTTEIVWDGPDVRALDGAERLWRFHLRRGWRRPAALPLRWLAAG